MAKKNNNVRKSQIETPTIEKKSEPKRQNNIIKQLPLWLVALVFSITTLVFFWNQLAGDAFFWDDFIEQVYPTQTYAAKAAADGEIPFWNPYAFTGMPFYADLQVGFFYPLNRLLAFFIDDNGNLSVWGLQFIIILHFWIAQFCMYLFMRKLKISSYGAMIGAVSYAFSFSLVLHVFHPMIIYHLAWFPLVLKFFYEATKEGNIKSGIVAGLIFGVSMLAGHPQTMLYEALFMGIMMIWMVIPDKTKSVQSPIAPKIVGGILTFVFAVGIFAIQYIPSSKLAENSARQEMAYEEAAEGSLQFKQLWTAFVPKLYGSVEPTQQNETPFHLDNAPYYFYWDTSFYFGLAAVILGLFAAIVGFKRRIIGFLLFISVFGFLFALGDNFFVFKIFYELPFFGLLRIPARMMFVAVFGFSALAGFGFDYLFKNEGIEKLNIKLYIAIGIPLLISFFAAFGILQGMVGTPEQLSDAIKSFGMTALLLSLVVSICMVFLTRQKLKIEIVGFVLVAVVFIDLFLAGASFNQGEQNPADAYKISPELKQAFQPKIPEDIFRVSMRMYTPSYMAMKRNQGVIDDIMLVEGYNQLQLGRFVPATGVRQTIHDLMNVRYDIAIDSAARQFRFVDRPTGLPRAWVAGKYQVIPDEDIALYMKSNKVDYKNIVLLEEKPGVDNSTSPIVSNVKFLSYSANEMELEAEADQDAMLVFSEVFYPEWKCYIDGEETKIYRANYSLRAIELPKGKHNIVMAYESGSFATGSMISMVMFFLAVGGIGFLTAFEKKKKLS
jgi:membrane protein YfhO